MNIYLNMTPEEATKLGLKIQQVARDVQDAIANRDLPNAYEYTVVGKTEDGEKTIRLRIGK